MQAPRRLLLVVALMTAGCSGSSERKAPDPALVDAWKVSSIRPVGQPVAAGETVVVYGTVGSDLYLYGLSVADGTVLWQRAASPSAVVPGIALTPFVLDGRVAYFQPDPAVNLAARLVVAPADTGADLLVSDPAMFHSFPSRCADGKDICVNATDGRGPLESRRFSLDARAAVPDPGPPPAGSRWVGRDLLDLGSRQPEMLAGFTDGTVRWRSSLAVHFPPGYTTDRGWVFERYRSAGVHVGSVGRPPDRSDASAILVDLSNDRSAAIDAATGASVWRSDGTDFTCQHRIIITKSGEGDDAEIWPVRCRYRGTLRYDKATEAVTYEGLDVTVEGFDVRTGDTTWSVPLGPAEAFMDGDTDITRVGGAEVLAEGAAGPVIVDLGSGATRTPTKGEAFWCETNVEFHYREPRQAGTSRRGGIVVEQCAADRSPMATVPRDIPKSLGATVGGRTVLATTRGLVAYDRRGA